MNTLFITYFSDIPPSNFYKTSAFGLKKRIESLGGQIYLEELPNLGDYAKNCLRKPKFIKNCLIKFNKPIIWIDADSRVNSLPNEMDNLDVDVACVEKKNGCPESALIFFNNTEQSIKFIDRWIEGCSVDKIELDHPVLKELWHENSKGEKRKSFNDDVCSVKNNSKVTIVLSNTQGKKQLTLDVIKRRKAERKII